jgi:biotin transport system ATP-binding protein
MIELNHVGYGVDGTNILQPLSLKLTEQRIGVIGANGSGKSSFLRLLNGLRLPTQGEVWVNHCNTQKEVHKVRRQVGFVFQNPEHQLVMPTVAEDLALGLEPIHVNEAELQTCIDHWLSKYGLLHLKHRLIHPLSGGEKQLIALIGVLAMSPNYLVLDEPTALLDLRNTNRLMRAVQALKQPILMATHDLTLLENFDRVLWFETGALAMDGLPLDVLPAYQAAMQC